MNIHPRKLAFSSPTFSLSVALFLLVTTIAHAQNNPVPLINNPLVPSSALPGSGSFTLTVNGTGFVSGSAVNWNGTPLATTFVTGSQLTATVPATNIATAGTASVIVVSPAPGGGVSNVAALTVRTSFAAASFDQKDIAAGNGAIRPITADFNADGKLDIAVVAGDDSAIDVLLGNGDGSFQPRVEYPVLGGPEVMATGDFNGDGKLDIVVSEFVDLVSVLLGNGDGTFQPHQDSSTNDLTTGLTVGDFNKDGKLDVAVALHATGQVAVLLGNGDGTFQHPVTYPLDDQAQLVATGDFNNDGNLDLVVTGITGIRSIVGVLLGKGDGRFQGSVDYDTAQFPEGIVVSDVNHDGQLDLVVKEVLGGGEEGLVSILAGNGDGTFQPHTDYSTDASDSVVVADLNGDGNPDIIVPSRKFDVVLLNKGNGHFERPGYFQTSGASEGGAFGDFNGDGLIDLVTGNIHAPSISVLPQVTSVLSDTLLYFGRIPVGTTVTKKVKLMNIGTSSLSVARIGLEGDDAADFTENNDCLGTVAPGAVCSITIVFAPTTAHKVHEARVAIRDSAVSVTQKIILQGAATN